MAKTLISFLFSCALLAGQWSFEGKSLDELNDCEMGVVGIIFPGIMTLECSGNSMLQARACLNSILTGTPQHLDQDTLGSLQTGLEEQFKEYIEATSQAIQQLTSPIQFPNEANVHMKFFSISAERYEVTSIKQQIESISEQYPGISQDVCKGIQSMDELQEILDRV